MTKQEYVKLERESIAKHELIMYALTGGEYHGPFLIEQDKETEVKCLDCVYCQMGSQSCEHYKQSILPLWKRIALRALSF